jgi:hypothetical protein
LAALALLSLVAWGCAGRPRDKPLTTPRSIVAPYDTARGEPVWAVLPLRNESGTTNADMLTMSDKLVWAVEQVRGVQALPLNRTIAAMRALDLPAVRSPAEARRIAHALGADAVLVGSITAYDPYHPVVGISLALFHASPPAAPYPTDASRIAAAPTESRVLPGVPAPERASALVSEVFDGRNHQVQMGVRAYAAGRTEPVSALGWERYLRSAALFEEFAIFSGVERLIGQEWTRLGRP